MKLKTLSLAIALALASQAQAQPTIANMTANTGVQSVVTTGSLTTITTNAARATSEWNNFNISTGQAVNIIQPNAGSAFLARINSAAPTTISGSLTSNGGVWLINPNGIMFGSSAVINVNSLVASTLGVTDADFLAGNNHFVAGATAGNIIVGSGAQLTAGNGGFIALVAPQIQNAGTLTAPNGTVSLTTGHDVTINGDQTVTVNVDPRDSTLPNPEGPGGALMSGNISNSGTIQASTAVAENGKIYFRAVGSISNSGSLNSGTTGTVGMKANGNVTTSANISGGTVGLKSTGGSITQSGGVIKATNLTADAPAGSINLANLANQVSVIDQATAYGSVTVKTAGDLTVNGQVSSSMSDAFLYSDTGNVTITANGQIHGQNVYIATPQVFTNNAGSAGVTTGAGRFVIYSNDDAADSKGGLTGTDLYDRGYTGHEPTSADITNQPGNLFVHRVSAPVVRVPVAKAVDAMTPAEQQSAEVIVVAEAREIERAVTTPKLPGIEQTADKEGDKDDILECR